MRPHGGADLDESAGLAAGAALRHRLFDATRSVGVVVWSEISTQTHTLLTLSQKGSAAYAPGLSFAIALER